MGPKGVYGSILDTIGSTPMIKLHKLPRKFGIKANVYLKCDFFNPGGSVKDRIAVAMIEDAEKKGLMRLGMTIIEPTSGNTGLGLAMVAAVKGYNLICVVMDKVSEEKTSLLKSYGADIAVAPSTVPPEDPLSYFSLVEVLAKTIAKRKKKLDRNGLTEVVAEVQSMVDNNEVSRLENILKEKTDYSKCVFIPRQHYNPVNPEAHYKTTGPEIWEQTKGKVDVFIAGMATGGTITGCAKYLKEKNPKIKVIGVDPEGSLFHEKFYGTKGEIHQYRVEGIGEDFIPGTIDLTLIDEIFVVHDKDAFLTARELAREEGILAGGSSGAAVFAALKISKKLGKNKNVVVIIPDTGRNYISKLYSDEWMKENGFL